MPLCPNVELPELDPDGGSTAERILACALCADRLPDGELWPAWSTGEILAVAFVLDRPDMIKAEGYTLVGALNRIDAAVVNLLPEILTHVERARQ